MILDFDYSDDDDLPWNAPGAERPAPRANAPAHRRAVDVNSIGTVARAVAVGATPLSELLRMLESFAFGSGQQTAEPVDVCGGEDSGCTSFLDRYLGGGADPDFLEEAELFKPA